MSHPIFTPTAVPPSELDKITVGDTDILEKITDRVRLAGTGSTRAHTLVVGPRGSGKTHTIAVAMHRAVGALPHKALAVGWVAEDSLAISDYLDLLTEIVRAMDSTIAEEARRFRKEHDVAALQSLLLRAANGRPLVLILENLDRIFAKIGANGQHQLRGFVETAGSILLVASTPLLFEAVSSRSRPWFGGFDVEHLPAFSAASGALLIQRVAAKDGRTDLAHFVGTPAGRSRLEAIEHLAGGSPRLWHILSSCATISTLDELVPAVQSLLEGLAPYYQQRLWELAPIEQKLVVELGREGQVRTVSSLADATGVSERATATALFRLAKARWVRGDKVPGTDRRSTWYELREPLLRHHLSYRDSRSEVLPFIVEFIRLWFDGESRRSALAAAEAGSWSESHLISSFVEDPPAHSNQAWVGHDPDKLLAAARTWILGMRYNGWLLVGPELGLALEGILIAAGVSKGHRKIPASARAIVAQCQDAVRSTEGDRDDRILAGLVKLVNLAVGDDAVIASVIAASWRGTRSPALAVADLRAVSDRLLVLSRLSLIVEEETAYWTRQMGDRAAARDLYANLAARHEELLGEADENSIWLRGAHAHACGEAGESDTARDMFEKVAKSADQHLGLNHPSTLIIRHKFAHWTGVAGNPSRARDMAEHLNGLLDHVFGPTAEATLWGNGNFAYWVGMSGEASVARDLFASLIPALEAKRGAGHLDTYKARANHAYWRKLSGDVHGALNSFQSLVPLVASAPDSKEPDSLWAVCRMQVASCHHALGDLASAKDVYHDMVNELGRLFGPNHSDSLAARSGEAVCMLEAGDWGAAVVKLEPLCLDYAATLGSDDSRTLECRVNLGRALGAAGEFAAAREKLTLALPALASTLEPDSTFLAVAYAAWLSFGLRDEAVAVVPMQGLPIELLREAASILASDPILTRMQLVRIVADLADAAVTTSLLLGWMLRRRPIEAGVRASVARDLLSIASGDVSRAAGAFIDVLDGDSSALAALPAELRVIARRLLDLDRSDQTDSQESG